MSLNVCFAALHALPAIKPSADRSVGGTETRAWTFARGLAKVAEIDVSFVVRGEPGLYDFVQDDVRILLRRDRLYALYESVGHCLEKRPGFPPLRLKRWSGHLLWQIPLLASSRLFGGVHRDPLRPEPFFEQIEADVFCTFGVQANSARVIASAHAVGKRAVLMIGSDGDLDQRYAEGSSYVSPYGDRADVCRWMITHADAVVVQTDEQKRMLNERFGRDGTVIANPIDAAWWDQRQQSTLTTVADLPDRYALWIGRAEKHHKRPQLLIELAQACPEVAFVMILNPRDADLERQIRRGTPANVRIVATVSYDEMPALFAKAAVLVSTSALEGFPNVFLQAALSRVPIASLAVGREFLAASHAGLCADDQIERLREITLLFWRDAKQAAECGSAGREYVLSSHDRDRQADRLAQVLRSVVEAT